MVGDSRRVTLGEVADITTGFPFKSAQFSDSTEDVRLLRGDNVVQGRTRWEGAKRWPADTVEDYQSYQLRPGDVVLAMDRPWIEAGLKHATITPADCPSLLVQRVARLRARPGLDQRYLSYVIGSADFTNYVLGVQTGTAVPHISGGQIRAYEFTLPPMRQQVAGAELLGALDDKIVLNRRMNRTLVDIARAIFKNWFVDFGPVSAKLYGREVGLPQDVASLFPKSFDENGIPEGWSRKTIGDCCSMIFSGGTPSTRNREFWDGGVPWLSSGETRNTVVTRTDRTISQEGADNSSARVAEPWSTVIASAGQGNTRGQTSLLAIRTYINQSTIALKADSEFTTDALLFLDISGRYDELRRISDGNSSRGSLTTKMIASLETVAPPVELVRAADRTLRPLLERVASAELENQTLSSLRAVLLPKLMSGDLQMKEIDHLAGKAGA